MLATSTVICRVILGAFLLVVLAAGLAVSQASPRAQGSSKRPASALAFNTSANYVFVTSGVYAANLGGVAAYDTKCNQVATGAGINNATNNAFIAWMSDSSSNAVTRLGSARGFVTTEGRPFVDTVADLTAGKILNPIRADQSGNNLGSTLYWTGTIATGVANSFTCSNWTSTSGNGLGGSTAGGPGAWTNVALPNCGQQNHLACFQKTSTAALAYTPVAVRTAFLTSGGFTPGGGLLAADQMCQNEASGAGLARPSEFVAYLSTQSKPASSRINLTGASYVRRDGIVVGTPAEIASLSLESGIWQYADGTYTSGNVFSYTGSPSPDVSGAAGDTCGDWTSTSGNGQGGFPPLSDSSWWVGGGHFSCANTIFPPVKLYCLRPQGSDAAAVFLLTATGRSLRARKGQPFMLAVASFTDADPTTHPSNYYSASIDWGDGTSAAAGTIQSDGGTGFQVVGNHAYQTTGAYDITVQISDVGGAGATVSSHFRLWVRAESH